MTTSTAKTKRTAALEASTPHYVELRVRVPVGTETLLQVPRRQVEHVWQDGVAGTVEKRIDDHHTVDAAGLASVELDEDGWVKLTHRDGHVSVHKLPPESELIVGAGPGSRELRIPVELLRDIALGRN